MTRILSILTLFTLLMPTSAFAQEFTSEQKEQLRMIMQDYLMDNGQVILDSVNKYQGELAEQELEEANKLAAGFISSLESRTDLAMTGNPKGDITIVEFFDYNCGYCTKALDEVQTILKDDKNVKVVFMDMPILGPSSLDASKWSLAAQKQGKYWEYHQAIMDHKGPKDDAALEKIAKELGMDVKKLKEDKDSQEIVDRLNQNIEDAQNMNIRGTPGFIIEGDITPGYIPAAEMKRIIEEKRKENG